MKTFSIKDSKGKTYLVKAVDEKDAVRKFIDNTKDSYKSDLLAVSALEKLVDKAKEIDRRYGKLEDLCEKYYNKYDGFRTAISKGDITKEKVDVLLKQISTAHEEWKKFVEEWNRIVSTLDTYGGKRNSLGYDLQLSKDRFMFNDYYEGYDPEKLKNYIKEVKDYYLKEGGTGEKRYKTKDAVKKFRDSKVKDEVSIYELLKGKRPSELGNLSKEDKKRILTYISNNEKLFSRIKQYQFDKKRPELNRLSNLFTGSAREEREELLNFTNWEIGQITSVVKQQDPQKWDKLWAGTWMGFNEAILNNLDNFK